MKNFFSAFAVLFLFVLIVSCASNPYAKTNRWHKKQSKLLTKRLQDFPPEKRPHDDLLNYGEYWAGTTNFNLRKPNYVVIHHTAQDSIGQTLKTFTLPRTQVSAHYVISEDGKIYHMLSDYYRAWHGGVGKWGHNTDLNSSSIGIELDNNGHEKFSPAQINSLIKLLGILKEKYNIPTANFIGHADIAPTRKNDPNVNFPWELLAEEGFGYWYDESVIASPKASPSLPIKNRDRLSTRLPDGQEGGELRNADSLIVSSKKIEDSLQLKKPDTSLTSVDELQNELAKDSLAKDTLAPRMTPEIALRIIGYDTSDLDAAIKSFKIHFIQEDVNSPLTDRDLRILYNLYKKYM